MKVFHQIINPHNGPIVGQDPLKIMEGFHLEVINVREISGTEFEGDTDLVIELRWARS